MASQKFLDSIGNGQGNSPEMALPCPQISSNATFLCQKLAFFARKKNH